MGKPTNTTASRWTNVQVTERLSKTIARTGADIGPRFYCPRFYWKRDLWRLSKTFGSPYASCLTARCLRF